MSSKSLTVHYGVYTYGMCVCSRRCAHHDDLAAYIFADIIVNLFHAHGLRLNRLHMYVFIVHGMNA